MIVLRTENCLCLACMTTAHPVYILQKHIKTTFKGKIAKFDGIYEYCLHTGSFMETEEMMSENYQKLLQAYFENCCKTNG